MQDANRLTYAHACPAPDFDVCEKIANQPARKSLKLLLSARKLANNFHTMDSMLLYCSI
jgi:hypothetical protein